MESFSLLITKGNKTSKWYKEYYVGARYGGEKVEQLVGSKRVLLRKIICYADTEMISKILV